MLERNWRCDAGEIDLVVAATGVIVVVEVKTRATAWFGSPAHAVDERKQRRLRALALRWLDERGGRAARAATLRFDVVAITPGHVEVIAGAF